MPRRASACLRGRACPASAGPAAASRRPASPNTGCCCSTEPPVPPARHTARTMKALGRHARRRVELGDESRHPWCSETPRGELVWRACEARRPEASTRCALSRLAHLMPTSLFGTNSTRACRCRLCPWSRRRHALPVGVRPGPGGPAIRRAESDRQVSVPCPGSGRTSARRGARPG